jgi:septum formation protein
MGYALARAVIVFAGPIVDTSPMTATSPEAAARIVLASASSARRRLLAAAGIACEVEPSHVDEAEVKAGLLPEGATPRAVADCLAELKAVRVSARRPGALVIGSDQVLALNGILFDKPPDMAHARAHLRAFRGKRHTLVSAVVVARDGAAIWRHVEEAHLTMRPFSDEFLDAYLAAAGESVLSSVGVYALEGLGAQLFSRIEGDHFTIQGLPLLPLLDFLRAQGACLA